MAKPSTVIAPEALARILKNHSISLIDVRDPEQWRTRHIPGAVAFDVGRFNIRKGETAGLLPSVEQFNEAAAGLGVSANGPVVVYDEAGGPPAGRTAWTLQAFGHPGVSMLDGGMRAWVEGGYPTTGDNGAAIERGDFRGEPVPSRLADADYIRSRLNDAGFQVVDARSAAEFRGEDVRARRGGHIPGAVNLNWTDTVHDGGSFKSADELNAMLDELGLDRDKETVCYCQSHQRSALLCLLLEALGFEYVKGYPGAWSDWGNRDDTPVETGE